MTTVLAFASILVAAIVVVALVIYLVAIIIALRRAGDNLQALAGGLQQIVTDSAPLTGHLTTINGALGTLDAGLTSADGHLVGVAEAFELV